MKVRNGFVSNSSSSSFLLIGFEIRKDQDLNEFLSIEDKVECEENFDNDPKYYLMNQDNFMYDDFTGKSYMGWVRSVYSDGDNVEIPLDKLNEKIEYAKNLAISYGYNPNDVKLIAGTMAC